MPIVTQRPAVEVKRDLQRTAALAAADLLDYDLPLASLSTGPVTGRLVVTLHGFDEAAVVADFHAWREFLGIDEVTETHPESIALELDAYGHHDGAEVRLRALVYSPLHAGNEAA